MVSTASVKCDTELRLLNVPRILSPLAFLQRSVRSKASFDHCSYCHVWKISGWLKTQHPARASNLRLGSLLWVSPPHVGVVSG